LPHHLSGLVRNDMIFHNRPLQTWGGLFFAAAKASPQGEAFYFPLLFRIVPCNFNSLCAIMFLIVKMRPVSSAFFNKESKRGIRYVQTLLWLHENERAESDLRALRLQ
jgi:hypothetical protein